MTESTFDRYAVLKAGDQFVIALHNSNPGNGPFMLTGEPMAEPEMRADLATKGLSPTKIEELIGRAIANPS